MGARVPHAYASGPLVFTGIAAQRRCGIHSAWIENQLVCADSRSPQGAAELCAQSILLAP